MTLRQERGTTAASSLARSSPATQTRGSNSTHTATQGLTNARTRIIGDRTGVFADLIIVIVRTAREIGRVAIATGSRIGAVVTPLGWSIAVLVPLAFLLGYGFGVVELVAIAFAGLVLLAVAVIYLIGRSAHTIDLAVPQGHVVVDEPANGVVLVKNPSRRRVLGTRVEIPVGPGVVNLVMPSLARGASFRHEFQVPTSARGVFSIGPVRTVWADPVGLVRREVTWTEQRRLFVHPRSIAIPSTSTGLIRDLEGQPKSDLSNSDVSFHALREYVSGDERRYIHWKSTAKTGTYMVRQFEETRRSRLLVALSLATSEYANEAEFEMAVSTAASLGIRAMHDARDVVVITGESTPEFAKRKVLGIRQLSSLSRTRLLDDLAGVQRAEASLTIRDIARVAAERADGVSVAYLVCGSPTTPGELRAASVLFPVGVEVVAIVCDPDAIPGLRRVRGLSVLTIGYLDDLKRSLSRAAAV